jgi:hypothetical protein
MFVAYNIADILFNCKRGFAYTILFINRGFEEHSSGDRRYA